MEKFKVYIHHYYTYELFWLYCHGMEIEPYDVPTWFIENRYNKVLKIEKDVTLKGKYKGKEIEVVFCNEKHWDKQDGFHLFDYSVNLLEKGIVSDRGFNSEIMNKINEDNLKLLNSKSKNLDRKVHYLYIDWEGHDPYIMEGWYKNLNPQVQFFVDEVKTNTKEKIPNHHFVFTNLIWSFIYPNTLGMRDYYFFHDYLKYKNDFGSKINSPIRRMYGDKKLIAEKILKLNNPNITLSISSFHNDKHYDRVFSEHDFKDEIISKMPDNHYVQKRGYGINDWGGEWNSNNMNENMWKMFGLSDVTLLYEHLPSMDSRFKGKNKSIGYNYITEKSVSHILVGKPFIPFYKKTIEFYDEYLKQYNKPIVEFPLDYSFIGEKISYLDTITKDEKEWNLFLDKLKKYVLNLRKSLIEIIHENNSYFDYVISADSSKKQSLL